MGQLFATPLGLYFGKAEAGLPVSYYTKISSNRSHELLTAGDSCRLVVVVGRDSHPEHNGVIVGVHGAEGVVIVRGAGEPLGSVTVVAHFFQQVHDVQVVSLVNLPAVSSVETHMIVGLGTVYVGTCGTAIVVQRQETRWNHSRSER